MIKFENVVKNFDETTVLNNFSLEIPDGCAYGLLGSNGAGKSTLLRILAGVYKTDGGAATVDGENVYDNIKLKQQIFFISDETAQFNNMTLLQIKDFLKRFYPNFSDEDYKKLNNVLNLPEKRPLSTFSKGMKRQAVMICGLAARTKYLLLDEAFDGLDPTMRIVVKKMLVDAMLDNNTTVIISSHNLAEIEAFCDRAGLLHKGGLIFDRELDTLKGNIHKMQTILPEGKELDGLEILSKNVVGSVANYIVKGDADEIKTTVLNAGAKFCDILPLSLEEVFVYEMEVLGYDHSGIDR